jgi:hypothetical protein
LREPWYGKPGKRSAHRTAPHRTAPHRTAPRELASEQDDRARSVLGGFNVANESVDDDVLLGA